MGTSIISIVAPHRFVKKTGDTMTGDLDLTTACKLIFGDTYLARSGVIQLGVKKTSDDSFAEIAVDQAWFGNLVAFRNTYRLMNRRHIAGDHALWLGSKLLVGQVDAAYTKKKEIALQQGGAYRIKFSMQDNGGTQGCYGKIYRNGAPVGTEQHNVTGAYVEYSEDISGWSAGDLLQLYCHKGGDTTDYHVKDLKVMVADPELVEFQENVNV